MRGICIRRHIKYYPGTSAHDIIIMMLDAFKSNVLPVYNQSGSGDPIDQVVTMASVIEREAANDGEKKLVASVFNNRLYEGKSWNRVPLCSICTMKEKLC